jgi:N-acetylmuramic acid 6-phosphate etherase
MSLDITSSLPITEEENPRTANLASLPVVDIVSLMNDEDQLVAAAVRQVLPAISTAVEEIVARLGHMGHLFYIGTGTSGRLGVLDAAECPPTFGVAQDLVQGVIAGGYEACYRAVEASEDDAGAAARDLEAQGFSPHDVLVGIAASGRTPYTVGAVSYARSLGAFTIALTCVPDSPITHVANLSIVPVVGPEVIAGSTRLKAGTAQKMVLNMLSTATLVKLGYVTGNRMTNLQARNVKLRARAIRILASETGLDQAAAEKGLEAAGGDLRVALVMIKASLSRSQAEKVLAETNGIVKEAIETVRNQGL